MKLELGSRVEREFHCFNCIVNSTKMSAGHNVMWSMEHPLVKVVEDVLDTWIFGSRHIFFNGFKQLMRDYDKETRTRS